jgi:SAM-dependent methyltransferase
MSDQSVPSLSLDSDFQTWCLSVAEFLRNKYSYLTPFPRYYDTQALNFLTLRQLLPEYLEQRYSSILEIGCGVGVHSLFLSTLTEKLLGVDVPGEYLGYTPQGFNSSSEVARKIVNEIFQIDHADFQDAFPNKLPCDSQSIDLIFTWTVLEHIPNLEEAYAEMYRVLKPGGLMIHVVPCVMSAIDTFVRANISSKGKPLGWVGAVRYLVNQYIKLAREGVEKGSITPNCHSEFLKNYDDQLTLYISDSYLHPLLRLGLKIERLTTVRDFNYALVLRKH